MRRPMASYVLLLFMAVTMGSPSRRSAVDLDATPRTTIAYNELSGARRFSDQALNYTTLLLEDTRGTLYVGARGAIFALNSSNIADSSSRKLRWEASPEKQTDCLQKGKNNKTECFNHVRLLQRLNGTHLYACGTYAFHPLCAAIDTARFVLPSQLEEGKEKCPYDPARGYTGLIVDGGLYTATRYEFRSLPDIRRNLHQRPLKTEESPVHWLNDAEFVASVLVRESRRSPVGDDDKIYYFFMERAGEESASFGKSRAARVARVARVCKSDLGGKKILQRKWTSFLKARLVCYIPSYEALKAVHSLDGGGWPSTTFYAAFTLAAQWRSMEASAVCQYNISELHRAFDGPYMHYQDTSHKWTRYDGEVPEPRPGSVEEVCQQEQYLLEDLRNVSFRDDLHENAKCITNHSREAGYRSSQDLPNSVLEFVKLHPLMMEEVKPAQGQPLLVKKNVLYTALVVDRVTALDGRQYDVLFLGTGDGWLHKAVVIGSAVHIVEELQVFGAPQPVESLVISKAQRSVYVGAASGVLQLPLASCTRYGSCYDCILAQDPYCAWDGEGCREVASSADRAQLTQDVGHGKEGCWNGSAQAVPMQRSRTVLRGDDVLLPCEQRSNLARAAWLLNGSEGLPAGRGHFRVGVDGLLVTDTLLEHSGRYSCYGEENGLRSPLADYALRVLPVPPPEPAPTDPPPPRTARHASPDGKLVYILVIAVLGGLCLVLSAVLLHVACLQRRRGKYVLGAPTVELQTVSAGCLGAAREEEEEKHCREDGCLQIIPGEAPPAVSPARETPLGPPPPPPPPLPAEFTNGIASLPNMLRKMNGNSYVLLRQQEEPSPSPLSNTSFAEELSKILEKRKHTQLVDRLDESSV